MPNNSTSRRNSPTKHNLQSFGLSNFKAFGAKQQEIPLRPITLVFGPNSSGKSSLIHFLLWMKDVVGGKGLDIYHPTAGGSSVDLGGFKQIRHGTDSETEIRTSLKLTIKDVGGREHHLDALSVFATCSPPTDYSERLKALISERWADILTRNTFESLLDRINGGLEEVVVDHALKALLSHEYGESRLHLKLLENDNSTDQHGEPFGLPRADLFDQHCHRLAQVKRDIKSKFWSDWEGEESSILQESPPPDFTPQEALKEFQDLARVILTELDHKGPKEHEATPALIRFELSVGGQMILSARRTEQRTLVIDVLDGAWLQKFSALPVDLGSLLTISSVCLVCDDATGCIPLNLRMEASTKEETDRHKKIIRVLEGTEEVPGLLRLCAEAAHKQFDELSYLGPLRAYPDRELRIADLPKESDPEGLFAWRVLHQNKDIRDSINEWLKKHSRYEVRTDDLVPLTNLRERLTEELPKKISDWVENVKSARELFDKHDNQDHWHYLYAAEDWKYPQMIQEAMETVATRVTSESSGTIFLRDLKSGKDVTSRDIGVGISQLIPVLVQAKASQNQLIAIEQPEIHTHPVLQAELGDVFIESALKQGNTFLIETHSEHLILRLLRRIRETTDGEVEPSKLPLKPSDLCILYVQPGEHGAKIVQLPVTSDGDFRVPWPGGFFAERATELFGPSSQEDKK